MTEAIAVFRLPVAYGDEVTEEKVRQIDDLVREEFEGGDWVTVESEFDKLA